MTARRVTAKVSVRIHESDTPESAAAAVKDLLESRLPGKDGGGHYVEDVQATVGAADVRDDDG